jgi:hypothetical protein
MFVSKALLCTGKASPPQRNGNTFVVSKVKFGVQPTLFRRLLRFGAEPSRWPSPWRRQLFFLRDDKRQAPFLPRELKKF